MRTSTIIFFVLLSINLIAQEHLQKGYSTSFAYVFNPVSNAKGIHLQGHYHLNSFDDLRLGLLLKGEEVRMDSVLLERIPLRTYTLEATYAKGFKINLGGFCYLLGGVFGGSELLNKGEDLLSENDNLIPSRSGIIGIKLGIEIELAPVKNFSFLLSIHQKIILIGTRKGAFEIRVGGRRYW